MWQLQQLVQFRAVYEYRSLSAAARALGVTQPALSRALQKLEEQLGAPLFQRDTRSLRPTEFATALYRQASRVLRESAGLDQLVERFQQGREGQVRLGCGPFVPDLMARELVRAMERAGLKLHLDVHTDHFEALKEGLYGYRYDFLLYDVRRRDDLPDLDDAVVEPLLNLPLKMVAPADWLRGEARAALESEAAALDFVAARPWAMPRVSPDYGRQAAPWFHRLLQARHGAEFLMPTLSACVGLCRAGHAITLAPDALIREEVAAGWLVSLPLEVGATAQTCAYRLRSRPLSQAAGRLWRLLAGGGLGMSEETLKPSASSRSSAD
ncbi:MAG: LysR family transcriptional regulator [Alcanivorax sp.]|uniref:LysR family transcriptional regulator n=1 Tax=Alloalcanivorax marinus TaxID=1177169 RepID=UPI0021CE0E21|nr:LysR family transcriptional regulator [Alloalcanivorax marinus]MCH2558498.1 LysR family transcriptional regulator [Alcanivorax sp.]MCU5785589.1 LysR family transcriptional regulator [Alloalcanivorax marinus]